MTPLPVPELQRTRTGMRDPPVLSAFKNKDVILRLPLGTKIRDIRWLSVWCRRFTITMVNQHSISSFSKVVSKKPGTGLLKKEKMGAIVQIHDNGLSSIVDRRIVDYGKLARPLYRDFVVMERGGSSPNTHMMTSTMPSNSHFLVHFSLVQSECRVALLTHWISLFPLASLGVHVPASLAGFYCEQISIHEATTESQELVIDVKGNTIVLFRSWNGKSKDCHKCSYCYAFRKKRCVTLGPPQEGTLLGLPYEGHPVDRSREPLVPSKSGQSPRGQAHFKPMSSQLQAGATPTNDIQLWVSVSLWTPISWDLGTPCHGGTSTTTYARTDQFTAQAPPKSSVAGAVYFIPFPGAIAPPVITMCGVIDAPTP
uniref:DM13 domain-containing protein n=1 Tax=Timema monikensis TaxID=170555 RepID=A0A7R9HKE7_9NEOP|nr:unnamed protein product [Timema monikensis]